eukprot:scaffold88290_cov63-Phaeocystis_antarctica.AAC.1
MPRALSDNGCDPVTRPAFTPCARSLAAPANSMDDLSDSLSFSDDDLELSLPDTSDVREAGMRQAKIERETERSGELPAGSCEVPAASADSKPPDDLEGTAARRPVASSHANTNAAALSPAKGWDADGIESCSDDDGDNSQPAPRRAAPVAPPSSGSASEQLSRPRPAAVLPAAVPALGACAATARGGAHSVRGVAAGSGSRFAPTAEAPSEEEEDLDLGSPSLDSTWNSQEFSMGISG